MDFDTSKLESKGMICASATAQSRKYHKIEDKEDNVWLYADEIGAASHIYVHTKAKVSMSQYSREFGGRTLDFPLVEGEIYKASGPWHSNAVALFQKTGVDLRQTHFTQVVIGLGRKDGNGKGYSYGIVTDVLHKDDGLVLGFFNRGDYLAAQFAKKLNKEVFRVIFSNGGSSAGWIKPSHVIHNDKDKW